MLEIKGDLTREIMEICQTKERDLISSCLIHNYKLKTIIKAGQDCQSNTEIRIFNEYST